MIKNGMISFLINGFICILLSAMEQQEGSQKNLSQELYSIVLPGQNGCGGDGYEEVGVINTKHMKRYKTLPFANGFLKNQIDFGQDNCIAHFEKQLNQDQMAAQYKKIFYGISQGTATLINWLAQKTHAEQEELAAGLVFESVLGSGDSAIYHTISTEYPFIAYIPFAKPILPLVAKGIYPNYSLWGKQAIDSAKNLSVNIPIFIIHNKKDFQLSINDARNVYCVLKEMGHKKVYLIETESGNRHFDLFLYGNRANNYVQVLNALYHKNGLPAHTELLEQDINLQAFQPSVEEVQNKISFFDRYYTIQSCLLATTIGLTMYGAYTFLNKAFAEKKIKKSSHQNGP